MPNDCSNTQITINGNYNDVNHIYGSNSATITDYNSIDASNAIFEAENAAQQAGDASAAANTAANTAATSADAATSAANTAATSADAATSAANTAEVAAATQYGFKGLAPVANWNTSTIDPSIRCSLYDAQYTTYDASLNHNSAYLTYFEPSVVASPTTYVIFLHGATLAGIVGPNMINNTTLNLLQSSQGFTDASGFTTPSEYQDSFQPLIDVARYVSKIETKYVYAMAPGERSGSLSTDYLKSDVWLPKLLEKLNIGATDRLIFNLHSGGGTIFNIALPNIVNDYNIVEVNFCATAIFYTPPDSSSNLFIELITALNGFISYSKATKTWPEIQLEFFTIVNVEPGLSIDRYLGLMTSLIGINTSEIIDSLTPAARDAILTIKKSYDPAFSLAAVGLFRQLYDDAGGNFTRIFQDVSATELTVVATGMTLDNSTNTVNGIAWNTLVGKTETPTFNIFHNVTDMVVPLENANLDLFLNSFAVDISDHVTVQPTPLADAGYNTVAATLTQVLVADGLVYESADFVDAFKAALPGVNTAHTNVVLDMDNYNMTNHSSWAAL